MPFRLKAPAPSLSPSSNGGNEKPGKIKSSLFSADGKLMSAFHNNPDGYVPLPAPEKPKEPPQQSETKSTPSDSIGKKDATTTAPPSEAPLPLPQDPVKPTSDSSFKNKKPGKIKSSLFSSDGKLVSAFHNSSDYVPPPASKPTPKPSPPRPKPEPPAATDTTTTMKEPTTTMEPTTTPAKQDAEKPDDEATKASETSAPAKAVADPLPAPTSAPVPTPPQVYGPAVDEFPKNKKPGKVKCLLFSADGQLVSPGPGGAASSVELAAKSNVEPIKPAVKKVMEKKKETKDDEKSFAIEETAAATTSISKENSEATPTAAKPKPRAEAQEPNLWSIKFAEGTKDTENEPPMGNSLLPTTASDFPLGDDGDGKDSFPALNDEYDDILDGQPNVHIKEEQLSWSCTEGILSDWKIMVQDSKDEANLEVYHVHKLVLSTGPTKSEYFDSICSGRNSSKASSNVTKFTLSSSAVKAFPTMLDFMYSREDKLDVNTENAVALRYLGRILRIRKLVVLVTTFIRDDMVFDKSLHYLNAGAEFDDQKVMGTAAQTCASHIKKVDREGLTDLVPPLFSLVVAAEKISCTSLELSQIVGEFCRKNEDKMTAELLQHITASSRMPEVSPLEAVYLLQLAEEHEGRREYNREDKDGLQARCIRSCSNDWNKTLVGDELIPLDEEVEKKTYSNKSYEGISSELKVVLLQRSLLKARIDFSDLDSTWEDNSKTKIEWKEQQVLSKDEQIRELQRVKSYLESEVIGLKAELSRFKRMPLSYDLPPKLKNCTYSPVAISPGRKRDPKAFADKQTKKFGTEQPSAMPSLITGCEANKAGYVIKESSHVWPVYYYKNV